MPSSEMDGKYMSSVKVGAKGQIVIPNEVRKMFNIKPGDTLLLLADVQRGIALDRYEVFSQVADAVFDGKARELFPEQEEQHSLEFATAIRQANAED